MMAVLVLNNVSVRYFQGLRDSVLALNGVSLEVDQGSIYGLLGPSGCGKSTLLHTFLSIALPNQGQVRVRGHVPGHRKSGVPGPQIGFMPQTLSLHTYFTVAELLSYYAKIFGIQSSDYNAETNHLLGVLQMLDKRSALVSSLSEGQKQRVSLACTLIHRPQILLLDEPTVGVDPVLRNTIWKYLAQLSSKKKVTILFSTHYIQEAAQFSHKVGLMRSGRIICQGCPRQLVNRLDASDLEEVFYKVCKIKSVHTPEQEPLWPSCTSLQRTSAGSKAAQDSNKEVSSVAMFGALLFKNAQICKRHWKMLIFFCTLPLVSFWLFLSCIGVLPRNLTYAVVNHEANCSSFPSNQSTSESNITTSMIDLLVMDQKDVWSGELLSCRILRQLQQEGTISTLIRMDDVPEAMESVSCGLTYGFLHFEKHFSSAVLLRMKALLTGDQYPDANLLNQSFAHLSMDSSNLVIHESAHKALLVSTHAALHEWARESGVAELARPLLQLGMTFNVKPDISMEPNVLMLPGLMLLVLHFMSVGLTADQLVTEQETGLLTREQSCGVTLPLIMLSQMFSHLILIIPLIGASMVFLVYAAGFKISISTMLILSGLLLLQTVSGMSCGFFLTSACPSRDKVMQLGVALILPEFLFSGILWPREAMAYGFMTSLSQWLPITMSCDLAKNLAVQESLYPLSGFIVPIIWTFIFFSLAVAFISKSRIQHRIATLKLAHLSRCSSTT